MNLPSFKRAMPVLTLLVIAMVLVALPHLDSTFLASARYKSCDRLVASDPDKALMFARSWRKEHAASPLAQHCEALALYATKDYPAAAAAFVELAKTTTDNPALAARLFLQGAQSYSAAGQNDQAKQAAVAALLLEPDNSQAKDLLAQIPNKNPAIAPASAAPPTLNKKAP